MATSILLNDDKCLEVFSPIWLDSYANDNRHAEQKLRSVINYLKKFQDIEECEQYIEKTSEQNRLILIVSGMLGREIVPSIHYHRKVKSVLTHIDDLISQLREDYKIQRKIEQPLAINRFLIDVKSPTILNNRFLFSQILIDCLLKLQSNEKDKNELIHLLQNEYQGNRNELNNINEFKEKYVPNKVLWWYKKDSFFSKTLNAALKTDNLQMIFLFRSLIFVIQQELQNDYPDETEILFMTGSIFRVEKVFSNENGMYTIQMSLCSENDFDLKQHIENDVTNSRILGKILSKTGRYNLAEKYFNRLIKQLSLNDPLLADLYEDLSELTSQTGDNQMSKEWHQKSITFKQQNQLPDESTENTFFINRFQMNKKWKQSGVTIAKGKGSIDVNQFEMPSGIYIDNDSQCINVADHSKHRIVQWNFGSKNWHVVAGGNGAGDQINQLNKRSDVIVDKKTNSLIICDQGNGRVVRWSGENKQNGKILISNISCLGFTTDRNGDLYVSAPGSNEVKRWKTGEKEGTIGAGGNEQGYQLNQLNFLTFIFVDEIYSLYVSELYNHRVTKWLKDAKEGIIVASERCGENSSTQLHYPQGVFANHLGDVYVADTGYHRIMCWPSGSEEGHIVVGGNGKGYQSNQFNYPRGIAFDRQNNLYVADFFNSRIQRFDIDKS
ncbi:unnamed protein product [Rotaria sp. Silwood1]|nr:unnamed protein product [Rotaria sp. Silwood1]